MDFAEVHMFVEYSQFHTRSWITWLGSLASMVASSIPCRRG